MTTQRYYDEFALGYDRHRGHPYHRLLDRLELQIIAPLLRDHDVLDLASGTGLLLMALQEQARSAVGVDLSRGMLHHARRRGLRVVQGSAEALPFPAAAFDLVCCFKAFPHLADPTLALAEMTRVCRPGGAVVLELYNPNSLRGYLRRFGPRRRVSESLHEGQVVTRFDTPETLSRRLPADLHLESVHGIRTLTPAGRLLGWPLLGPALGRLEAYLSARPRLFRWAGFLVVTLRRTTAP